MAKFTVVGVLAVAQATAALNTRVVPAVQFPPPDIYHPQGNVVYDTTFPPCLSQGEVEGKCAPTADNVEGWKHQRDCMCKGSFFEDAVGCGACKKANALQTTEETAHWDKIFQEIQDKFCKAATPTSNFAAYWSSALSALGSPSPKPEDERRRHVAAGDTVVENYYKAPKTQGPGVPVANATAVGASSPATVATHAPVVTGAPVGTPVTPVALYAASSVRYQVAKISAMPMAPSGPKFPMNQATGLDAKAEVKYVVAAMPCTGVFVSGNFQASCGAFEIKSDISISVKAAPEVAVDFSACTCAVNYLAKEKLQPLVNKEVGAFSGPSSGPAKANAPTSVVPAVHLYSPEQCVASCRAPAPAQGVKTVTKAGDKKVPSKPAPAKVVKTVAKAGDKKVPSKPAVCEGTDCHEAECGDGPECWEREVECGDGEECFPTEKPATCSGADCVPAPARPAGAIGTGVVPAPVSPAGAVGTGVVPSPRPAGSNGPVAVVSGSAVSGGVSGVLVAVAAAFALL